MENLTVYVYYYYDLTLAWSVQSIRPNLSIKSLGNVIVLNKTLISNISKTKNIIGFIIYSTEPLLSDAVHFKTVRPRLIKYHEIVKLKSDINDIL